MRLHTLLLFVLFAILTACIPAESSTAATTPKIPSQIPTTPPATLPSATLLPTSTAVLPTSTALPTQTEKTVSTPTPTLNAWEMVQVEVARLKNLLDRESDGYNGLTSALQQDEPNPDWCAGLSAAIGDFNYVGDTESAQTLEDLQSSQGCS